MEKEKRKEIIEQFLIDCCKASSIYYAKQYPAVKYLRGLGKVVFIEQSRMLDYCERSIPDYNAKMDEAIIDEILKTSYIIGGCESHEYQGCHYCLTIMLNIVNPE